MLRMLGLKQFSRPLSRQTIRLQSTAKNPETVDYNKAELDFEPDLAFSVFPRIQDVQASDLIGNNAFGKDKYYMQRSATGNLPVYLDVKNGGSVVTELRKIQGNVIKLRDDLQEQLPHIPKENFKCIMQSNKLVIKGDFIQDVKRVLKTTF
ncbi:hypothetical protein ZYGR_0AK03540 [Zygosaccharomyces rouxii]|uniref:Large ribosomal subunit protein mL49 n=1 Tax=Zygosaccharomyces rouxii TaxID=4956 RepID=A0A1Q3ADV3_ZYGRO|nr:hypothetical protein ZYGR_0AK03540 [Zygosaccharomyces rouxii]